jgi:hypothetical protein
VIPAVIVIAASLRTFFLPIATIQARARRTANVSAHAIDEQRKLASGVAIIITA